MWHSSAQPLIICVFLLLQISYLHRAHPPQWPHQCICLCQNFRSSPPAVSTLMPIFLLKFWLYWAPSCVCICTIHQLWLYSCPVISQGPDKRLFACFDIRVETNQPSDPPTDRPRYRLQDDSWPNHKNSDDSQNFWKYFFWTQAFGEVLMIIKQHV